jgi:nucleoside-diphosphate-sugar epimerase
LSSTLDGVRLIEGDISDFHSIRSALNSSSPETVVHLGALTPVRFSYDNPHPYERINFGGTINVVHAVLDLVPRARVVLASTAEVYGWHDPRPIKESENLKPSSPYGVSKAAADMYVQMATNVYGLRAVILRCNNTYGRIHEGGFLTEYVIDRMLRGETVYIGTSNHIRDYMYVDDHVDAYVRAIENPKADGKVFNVSPGNPTTNLELAKRIASLTSFRGRIIEGAYPPGYPMRPSAWDTEYIVLDSSRIRDELGWSPSVTLEEGLTHAIASWKNHHVPT